MNGLSERFGLQADLVQERRERATRRGQRKEHVGPGKREFYDLFCHVIQKPNEYSS